MSKLNHVEIVPYFSLKRFGMLMLGIVSLATLMTGDVLGQTLREKLPDIVFVISDDQAWKDYSFMGHEHIQTPHIDQLARESLVFTRGYVPDSLCRPSLATMISGLYPHQHGIVGNDPPPRQKTSGARGRLYSDPAYREVIAKYLELHVDTMQTLPDRLKPLGYKSLQTGKWWEGNFARGGFDEGMTHGDLDRGGRHGDLGLEIGRKTMQPISDFIERSKADGNPYFLWYAPFLPHSPHNPPEKLLEKYLPIAPSESIAKYWAMCEWFDQTVGELRSIIQAKGDPANTIIVYVCDNGWINLVDEDAYAPRSKRSQYDGGIRTPILVHWPGKIEPSRDESHLACSIDLVPTVMALLGIERDASLPGIDLTSRSAVSERKVLFGEILEHDIQSMDKPETSLLYRWAIEGSMKLIVPNSSRVPNGQVELFDLMADPWEEHNIAAGNSETVAQLSRQLDSWWPTPKASP